MHAQQASLEKSTNKFPPTTFYGALKFAVPACDRDDVVFFCALDLICVAASRALSMLWTHHGFVQQISIRLERKGCPVFLSSGTVFLATNFGETNCTRSECEDVCWTEDLFPTNFNDTNGTTGSTCFTVWNHSNYLSCKMTSAPPPGTEGRPS